MRNTTGKPARPERRAALKALGAAALGTGLAVEAAKAASTSDTGADLDALSQTFAVPGKVAVLTDFGGKGSREIALLLAKAGATIVLADRKSQQSHSIVQDIGSLGRPALLVDTEIEKEGSVVRLFKEVERRFHRLDILVNCAGLYLNQPLTDTSLAQWEDVQAVNLRANFLCMREGVKLILKGGAGGRVVNVTTIGALRPVLVGNEAYAAARAGVTALSNAAALDYVKDGILVNTIFAGAIPDKVIRHPDTERRLASGDERTGPMRDPDRLPLGMGGMKDVAAAVLYLVGPSGAYITGQSIVLDGGFMLT